MQALHTPRPLSATPPFHIAITLPTRSTWAGIHSFEGSNPLCPHFPGKTIKLFFFYFTQTLVSEIQFGTTAPRLRFSTKLKYHLLCDSLSNSSRPSKFISSVSIKASTSSHILKYVLLHYHDLFLCLSPLDSSSSRTVQYLSTYTIPGIQQDVINAH